MFYTFKKRSDTKPKKHRIVNVSLYDYIRILIDLIADPIAEDYRTVVCPFIDVIDYENFQYRPQDEGARGAFDWEFFYKRLPLLPEDLKHPAEPFK